MTRHRSHRDRVGDRVADSFLAEDLQRATTGIVQDAYGTGVVLRGLLKGIDEPDEKTIAWLARLLWTARLEPELRLRLVAYLGDRTPSMRGRCLWCLRELPARQPGQAGRRALYCGVNHRQDACRARRRANLPPQG
ncbi:hypothetical protein ACFXHA_43380 [Nocardia sp. NPDC059240]|uniref:hypothetical protein n=1 Tax=Nocardia sp. NPDC059240 TaxID=3346786 RepID=UPI003674AA13